MLQTSVTAMLKIVAPTAVTDRICSFINHTTLRLAIFFIASERQLYSLQQLRY